jgi:hypothetical protein
MLQVPSLGDAEKGQMAMIMTLKDLGLAMCAVLIANASEN